MNFRRSEEICVFGLTGWVLHIIMVMLDAEVGGSVCRGFLGQANTTKGRLL